VRSSLKNPRLHWPHLQWAKPLPHLRSAFNMSLAIAMLHCVCACDPPSSEQGASNVLTQQLDIVWVVSRGGDTSLQLTGLKDKVTAEELHQLENAGVKGVLYVRMAGTRGQEHEKRARLVVVMSRQIHNVVELRQPDGTNAIYVQNGDAFEMLPKDTPTLAASIRLVPTRLPDVGDCTEYEIIREDGGGYGGTAFIWSNTNNAVGGVGRH